MEHGLPVADDPGLGAGNTIGALNEMGKGEGK